MFAFLCKNPDYKYKPQSINQTDLYHVLLSFQCYQGPDCKFRLEGLEPKTKCFVRVCAIRQSHDGSKDLPGNYSMTTVFTTSEEKVANNVAYGTEDGRNSVQLLDNKRPITDQQWALIIILGFFVISACVAYAAQQFIS